MKNDLVIEKLMTNSRIKNLGLKKESIIDILKAYNEIAFNILLEKGQIELGNGITIEVVQLIDRVHVLRGVSYKSSRKYKLKLTMEDAVYEKIEEYYNRLQEEIL